MCFRPEDGVMGLPAGLNGILARGMGLSFQDTCNGVINFVKYVLMNFLGELSGWFLCLVGRHASKVSRVHGRRVSICKRCWAYLGLDGDDPGLGRRGR